MKRHKVTEYVPMPAGSYPVQCVDVVHHEMKQYKDRLQFVLSVVGGEHQGKLVSAFCNEPKMLTPDSVLFRYASVFIGEPLEKDDEFGPLDLVGLHAIALVSLVERGDGFRSNEVENLHHWDGNRDAVDLAIQRASLAFVAAE